MLHMCRTCAKCAAYEQSDTCSIVLVVAPHACMHASAAALPLYYVLPMCCACAKRATHVLHIAIVRSSHHGDGNVPHANI